MTNTSISLRHKANRLADLTCSYWHSFCVLEHMGLLHIDISPYLSSSTPFFLRYPVLFVAHCWTHMYDYHSALVHSQSYDRRTPLARLALEGKTHIDRQTYHDSFLCYPQILQSISYRTMIHTCYSFLWIAKNASIGNSALAGDCVAPAPTQIRS
jgi:hypothetical protein